jgi:uncharacterized protein (PEP-CTERM system associated)
MRGLIGSALYLAMLPPAAMALDWEISPTVSASATVTDNGGQTTNGSDGTLILSVTPAVSVASKGSRRVQANLNYSLSAVERFGDNNDDSDDLNHFLNATGKAELVEDLFFVEGSAGISQALKSLLGAPGDSTLDTGNRSTVGTYSLSPYLTKRFGTFGTGILRYRRNGALLESGVGNDIDSNSYEAGFNSGSQFNDLSWGLNYSLRESSTQGGVDNQFERYSASLGYALSRKLRLNGTVGYDKNDYLNATNTSGESWSVGATWAPSRRTTLDASFGERYFGNTYGFGFTHRSHFTQWNVRYSEDISDISQQLLNFTGVLFWDCNGTIQVTVDTLTPPQPGCILLTGVGELNTSLARGVYVIKSLNGGVSWSRGKTGASLTVYDTRRSYQQLATDQEDQTRGITGSISYRLDPHTSVTSSLGYTNNIVPPGPLESLLTERDDDTYTFSIGINRQFQPKVSGSLVYRHQQRESSDSASADFSENSLTATVTMRF